VKYKGALILKSLTVLWACLWAWTPAAMCIAELEALSKAERDVERTPKMGLVAVRFVLRGGACLGCAGDAD
jgi:hypothetical protein